MVVFLLNDGTFSNQCFSSPWCKSESESLTKKSSIWQTRRMPFGPSGPQLEISGGLHFHALLEIAQNTIDKKVHSSLIDGRWESIWAWTKAGNNHFWSRFRFESGWVPEFGQWGRSECCAREGREGGPRVLPEWQKAQFINLTHLRDEHHHHHLPPLHHWKYCSSSSIQVQWSMAPAISF